MDRDRPLDVVCLGRAAVDLYGQQVGGRLEDMASFAKYVGGSPANIAIGAARLGLAAAMISRVGDEHMGRFVRETLAAEGVDVSQVHTDPGRLTGLVILGVRDASSFPHIFYRDNCADMALTADHIDADAIGRARALLLTGTHLSAPGVEAASRAALACARARGLKVALDIDYRPVAWGQGGHGAGDSREAVDARASARFQSIAADCDLVVGTEEEMRVAGGVGDTLAALARLRAVSGALLVVKRGANGCVAFPGPIHGRWDDGVVAPGFAVEVFNTIGAGDGFMAGLLRGWLRDEPLETCLRYANACGAIVVSRHGCAPATPTWPELCHFLDRRGANHVREDAALAHLHWATTRRGGSDVLALAIDRVGGAVQAAGDESIARFRDLCRRAVAATAPAGLGGLVCGDDFGRTTLDAATGSGLWIGRPIEAASGGPRAFSGGADVGLTLATWPTEHRVVGRLAAADAVHPRPDGGRRLMTLFEACRATGHELALGLTTIGGAEDSALGPAIEAVYALGVRPDLWLLPAQDEGGWGRVTRLIDAYDPLCRGALAVAHGDEAADLDAIATTARHRCCRGFVVGAGLFGAAADAWLGGRLDDQAAVTQIAAAYGRAVARWRTARAAAAATAE